VIAWIDWILAGMALETVALLALNRRVARAMLPNLAAGGCLLLAMRLALSGAWWGWVSVSLLGGLAGHLADLRARWRNKSLL